MAVAPRRLLSAKFWQRARQVGARLSWGIADQAMCSLTNFLLTVFVARSLGATQFGAFTLAYVTYGFAINASRGLSIEPLLIRFSGTSQKIWRRAASGSTGTALVVGLATGTCALAAGALIGGTTGRAFVGLGLMLPGLLLQDSWRYAFFALGRGYHAFINDSVWAAVQIPLLVVLKMTGHTTVLWFVIAWGAGAYVGCIVASFQARAVPSLVGAMYWLVRHNDLGPRYFAENAGGNAASTVQSYCISSILGLKDVGYMQAASVFMGPFKIIYFGLSMITIPEAARILRRSPRELPVFCIAASAGVTVVALVWSAALLVALPLGLGQLMLGNIWRPSYPLVLPTALAILASCAGTGGGVGLHALGAARRSLRASIIAIVLGVSSALVGAFVDGAAGTLYFAAAAAWVSVLVTWWTFRKAMHESGTVPVPSWLFPPRPGGKHEGTASAKASQDQAEVLSGH